MKKVKNAAVKAADQKINNGKINQATKVQKGQPEHGQGPVCLELNSEGIALVNAGPEPAETKSELSKKETASLAKAEKLIKKGLKDFRKVGAELNKIRQNRWYRAKYTSFEQYCKQKWNICRSHGYRLIKAAETAEAMSQIGDSSLNQEQALALSKVAQEDRQEVLQEAAKEAGDQAPTAKQIQKAAAKTKGNQSTVSALKLVAAEEQEPADHDELQADDQSAPDQTERADTKPGRTKIPLPVILEWVQDLWRELDQMEGAEEACALISRIERELGRYVPDNQEEEVAA